MYINNIVTTILPGSEINMFADDIALYRIITSPNDYALLQEDISAISNLESLLVKKNEVVKVRIVVTMVS